MEDTTQVLETATKIADKVVLSSILPRTDNSTAHLKGENINPQFRNLCMRMPKVHFIDNDKNFRLADASPNDAYVDLSGLHLSKQGTQQLIKNLEVKAVFRKRSPRQPTQPANFHSNISQNYMLGKTSSTASVQFNQNYYMGNSANLGKVLLLTLVEILNNMFYHSQNLSPALNECNNILLSKI